MRYYLFLLVLFFTHCGKPNGKPGEKPINAQDPVELSKTFFDSVKDHKRNTATASRKALEEISEESLKTVLTSQDIAKAFWLNIYNTNVQYLLSPNPSLFDDRGDFFEEERIIIAGQELSLEDIEHGIIRHSRNKISMGYLGKIFVSDFEKTFRLDDIDYRIHFALNCGAKSCPPVAFYEGNRISEQLEKSARNYLKKVARYDAKKNEVYVPALCSWFKADFDGKDGTLDMMIKYGIVPKGKSPDVEYLDYDWTLKLDNYTSL